jgi:hypothetical protein
MAIYSVDRRGFCKVGGTLDLMRESPLPGRRIVEFPNFMSAEAFVDNLSSLFPEGLSFHGWAYLSADLLIQPQGYPVVAAYEPALEIIFEVMRLSKFAHAPSRFQSYFAWETKEAAKEFANGSPIYEVESETCFRADQAWLRLGYQGAMTLLFAERYWSGVSSVTPRWEILLTPPVHVLSRVEHGRAD